MYRVYVNGEILYDSIPVFEDSLRVYSPVLTLNKEGGLFEFTLPKGHPLWSVQSTRHPGILFMSKIDQIIVENENGWLWEGFPSDYSEDYSGNWHIVCKGGLHYLEDAVAGLVHVVNYTKNSDESNDAYLARCIRRFTESMCNHHNERLDEIETRFGVNLDHQKIFCNDDSVFDVTGGIPPYHFSRITDFENCYDALDKRIISDFGGYFYLTKKNGVLVINYCLSPKILPNATVILGKNLIDYNVSEEFVMATSAIPRGNTYDENHPGESKWWLKDERSAFYDIEQRASYQWREYNNSSPKYPTAGSRVYLPTSPANVELVKRYGFNDVIIEFDSVVAKYPGRYNNRDNGWEYYLADNMWSSGKEYPQGKRFFYRVGNSINVYESLVYHYSKASEPPTTTSMYALCETGISMPYWLSIADYLGESPWWNTHETVSDDRAYVQDYMAALRILAVDYLENQQYNKLVLNISASKISYNEDGELDPVICFGKKLPVSADLFGTNLRPYEVAEVSITIDDDSQSMFTLGGEDTKITRLVRERSR